MGDARRRQAAQQYPTKENNYAKATGIYATCACGELVPVRDTGVRDFGLTAVRTGRCTVCSNENWVLEGDETAVAKYTQKLRQVKSALGQEERSLASDTTTNR